MHLKKKKAKFTKHLLYFQISHAITSSNAIILFKIRKPFLWALMMFNLICKQDLKKNYWRTPPLNCTLH